MSELARLQDALQARIVHGSRAVDPEITAADPQERERRLRIYEHAYVVRLVGALGDTYKALRATVGQAEFDRLAGSLVRAVPSVHRSIGDYGADLAGHIVEQRDGIEGRVLAELARWEWLLAGVFDAADASVLTVDALARVPPDRWGALRFVPHPSVRRFTSTTNAIELWRVATGAATIAGTDCAPDESSAAAGFAPQPPVDWIAWRSNLKTIYRSVAPDETRALDAMLAGVSFGDICEGLASEGDPESAPLRAAQLVRGWVEAGLLSGF